jgi:hypothetical protein
LLYVLYNDDADTLDDILAVTKLLIAVYNSEYIVE